MKAPPPACVCACDAFDQSFSVCSKSPCGWSPRWLWNRLCGLTVSEHPSGEDDQVPQPNAVSHGSQEELKRQESKEIARLVR